MVNWSSSLRQLKEEITHVAYARILANPKACREHKQYIVEIRGENYDA